MKLTAIFPGRYVQQEDALELLHEELARIGDTALIIAGKTAEKRLIPLHEETWRESIDFNVEVFGGECCQAEIDRLAAAGGVIDADIVVGLGGGKVIDTAKAVADQIGAASAIVPTIASTDAPTSAVSVIYSDDGSFERYLFLPCNPDLVVVDTGVIARAPVRFLVAGMGDALATWFEADSCRRTASENQCGGHGTRAAFALAQLCLDTIFEFGVAARAACLEDAVTPALSHVVEANTLLSGIGFESGGLGAAHSIHNGLTRIEGSHDYYHGEKVAIGVLAGLFLSDRPMAVIDQTYDFCERVGLPTTLQQIGVSSSDSDGLEAVAEAACADQETIHHEAGKITPRQVVAALLAADRTGRERQTG